MADHASTAPRYAAVRYSQNDGRDEAFSIHGPLSPNVDLLTAAKSLLDRPQSTLLLPDWKRGFRANHGTALGQPACIWRARHGWLMTHIATPRCWRDFCATFLNRTIREQLSASAMWRSYAVHHLVTTILSTHDVRDAAMTCQLYDIPSAALSDEPPYGEGSEANRVEWAVISADAMEVQDVYNRGISNGK